MNGEEVRRLDPIEPGAVALTSIGVTKYQARKLAEHLEGSLASGQRLDSVRLEKLPDAWLRLVRLDPEGDPVDDDILLPPTGPMS
jgi:hypothetical protein